MGTKTQIAIGADHGGYKLKEELKAYLKKKGYSVKDFGAFSPDPSDYPLFGYKVARGVSEGEFKRGILICKTGIGMAIIANKLPNVRSGVCNSVREALTSRQHNDTNVLSLAAKFVDTRKAKMITSVWLTTEALKGRHKRRVGQIKRLERAK